MVNPETTKQLEALRAKSNRLSLKINIIYMLLGLVGISCFTIIKSKSLMFYLVATVAMILIISYSLISTNSWKAITAFKTRYKQTFVKEVLSECISLNIYKYDAGFPEERVLNFGLIDSGNTFHSEDYLNGIYNEIEFEQADVVISHDQTLYDKTEHITFFNGRMLVFDYPHQTLEGVQVYTRDIVYAALSPIGQILSTVQTGNSEFDSKFKIKAQSEQVALDVLTPSVMARILDLNKRYNSLIIYFANSRLYLGIQNVSNAFDPPNPKNEFSSAKEEQRIRDDLQVTLDVIDTMTQNSVL